MARDLKTELETLKKMAGLHCRARHGGAPLCPDCRELLAAAAEVLRRCPRDPKPACRKCPAPCWPPALRERLRELMRYAGPRLPLRHPLLALKHYLKDF
ncbi:MAG: nitrous oxide-stimulated promoter family protein [Elusimicrobiales bacterium]|nr:nitrous oxide-stimulated promoter family protein [Elusimicrobiales bacterium]